MPSFYVPAAPISWNWVSLIGADAQDFLHRLTTVNVRALQLGEGAPGCFLNPQGRIRTAFTLWNYAPNEYAFEFDAGETGKWKQELLATIDQFTFGEKISVVDLTPNYDQFACRWLFLDSEKLGGLNPRQTAAIESAVNGDSAEEVRVCHHGDADFGRNWYTAWGRPARLQQWLERALPDAMLISEFSVLERWRISAVRPRVDREINESANPLEIGLKDSIAQNKGCYPGQEVIEKIIALGSPAKRLALITGAGDPPPIGEKIYNLAEPPVEVGQITSVTHDESGQFSALAVLRKIHAKEGLEIRVHGLPGKIVRIAPYA